MIQTKPKLFIGSASESLRIVEALQYQLRDDMVTEAWNKSFRPGHYTLDELVSKATNVDFAVFVLGNDDKTESRGSITVSPRDNVVYEAGLFAGYLDVKRVFLLIAKGTKIPTDWNGLGYFEYNPSCEDANEEVLNASIVIRKAVNDWKKKATSSFENQILGHWWQYVLNAEEGAVVSFMSIKCLDNSILKINGESWTKEGKNIAKFWSRASAFDNKDRKIFYYWEGEHPFDSSIPRFIGVGEIQFDEESKTRGAGWYSSTPLHKVDETTRRSTIYIRANEEEVLTMQGNDRTSIQKLINFRCNEFKLNL